ncbi:Thiosulfate/3-mercaptopyruvate sulfurtransferase OS=Ureibacillus acetophenoni OX=614649 GN=SAMN05877842_103267 PE=4 SV=1 [Ureibacillus acetophenoni]
MGRVFVDANEVKKEGLFIDTRFNLQDKTWGQTVFNEGHIEGAVYWGLESDLSDMSGKEGRHPMPTKEQLTNLFESAGLQFEDTIYIYDQGAAPFAARAWWMLKYANFPNVYIVNGGMIALTEVGFGVTSETKSYPKSTLSIQWNDKIYANRDDVKQIVDGKEQATLLDARAAVRYKGEHETIDVKAGHIPTAKNFDWEQLKVDSNLSANEELLNRFKTDDSIVVYCGSGVTASPLYAVLADSGYENIRLYVGSFSDWITQYEVETGENE